MKAIEIADLFCGAGGSSSGAVEAIRAIGYQPRLTAINHWQVAVATHSLNHPLARHLCTAVDEVNPRMLYRPGKLDLLWASPECTHHSVARGGKPINEQSRATAWCVPRWAEAVRPKVILVENVPEFQKWPAFKPWFESIVALGYRGEARVLCSADYGDPTTRRRLFMQFVRRPFKIVWPKPTHGDGTPRPWVPVSACIDWSIPMQDIAKRKRPLASKTLKRIAEGLAEYGGAVVIAMEHGGRVLCAKGGAFGLAYVLPQHGGGNLRPASEPCPTVATSGALALIVEYYGNGKVRPVTKPLPSVTTHDRFALIRAQGGQVFFRMLRWHELAAVQGFAAEYRFTGKVADKTKQIGNAVTRRVARALVAAVLGQRSDVSALARREDRRAA